MCVPYGQNFNALMKCFKELYIKREELHISTFGFSYMSFHKATDHIRSIYAPHIFKASWWKELPEFHLLGITKELIGIAEIGLLASYGKFRSIDSSLAACVTSYGQSLLKGIKKEHLQRDPTFFELQLDPDLLDLNMKELECTAELPSK